MDQINENRKEQRAIQKIIQCNISPEIDKKEMEAVVEEYSMRAGASRLQKALPPDPEQIRQNQVRDMIDKGHLHSNNMVKQTN